MAGHITIWLRSLIWFLALAAALEVKKYYNIRPGLERVLCLQRNLCSWLPRTDFDQVFLVTHRIQLNRVNALSDKNRVFPVYKITKHGLVSPVLPNELFWIDLTVHMDKCGDYHSISASIDQHKSKRVN